MINFQDKSNYNRLTAAILALTASSFLTKEDRWWGIGMQCKTYVRLTKLLDEKYRSILTKVERSQIEKLQQALSSKELVERFPCQSRYNWSCFLINLKNRLVETES